MTQEFDTDTADTATPRWIHMRTYHRGLDGMLSPTSSISGKASKSEDAGKNTSKSEIRTQEDSRSLERPFGQSQFDYLRRLAASLKNTDDELRRSGEGGIRAVGILGNDVFDKLLVLRALRPLFPGAVFFTTDYDAALTGQDELDWTRNLLIASSYGPTVAEDLQKDIPPFRSTYQTSAFLAARLAAEEREGNAKNEKFRKRIEEGVKSPRILEINRHGELMSLSTKQLPAPRDNGKLTDVNTQASIDIHPAVAYPFPRMLMSTEPILAAALAVSALVALFFFWQRGRGAKAHNRFVGLTGSSSVLLTFAVAAIATFFWEEISYSASEKGLGEPVLFFHGVSLWPAVVLRALAAIAAILLICDAWRELRATSDQGGSYPQAGK